MKVPEFLFPIVNPIMTLLLNSPLHGVMSGSILVLYFTGRRSGKAYSTPVRYFDDGESLVLVTGTDTGWWPNLVGGVDASIQLRGSRRSVRAQAFKPPAPEVAARVIQMLDAHPADAVYMDVEKDSAASRAAGKPVWDKASLDAATQKLVAVELRVR
ncbi:MAG: nitroreductase/quinone reductase family protein [Pseudomonadota bacterium]